MATNDKPDELYPERKDIEVSELAPAIDQDELQLVTYFTGDARWTGGDSPYTPWSAVLCATTFVLGDIRRNDSGHPHLT